MSEQTLTFDDMTSDGRRQAVLRLLRQRPRRARDLEEALRVTRSHALHNLLSNMHRAGKIDRSYPNGERPAIWHLPGTAPQEASRPGPAPHEGAKPQAAPEGNGDHPAPRPSALHGEHCTRCMADHPSECVCEDRKAPPLRPASIEPPQAPTPVEPDKIAVTSDGTLMVWVDGRAIEYSNRSVLAFRRMMHANAALLDAAAQREHDAQQEDARG